MDSGSVDGPRRRRAVRRLIGFGFVVAMAMVMQPLSAQEPEPGLSQVTTTDGYKEVVLVFQGDLYGRRDTVTSSSTTSYTVSEGLAFTSSDAQVPTVSRSNGTYTLTFANAVDPHTTVITVNGGTAYGAGGEEYSLAPVPVPFSSSDLEALAAGLKALPGLSDVPEDVADLPFVRDWLTDAELSITELVPGLADVPADPATEAELLDALYALGMPSAGSAGDGIFADIAFGTTDGNDVDVTFNPSAIGSSFDMTGVAGVEEIGGVPFDISLDGEIEVGVGLGGDVALDVTSGALTVVPGASDPEVVLSVDGAFSPEGRLGVVDVTAPETELDLDAAVQLDLACPSAASACAPSALLHIVSGPTGTATLTIDQIEVDFAGTVQEFTGTPLLELHWSDLGDLTTVTAPVDALGPVRGFTSVSVNDIAGGVQWIATWLSELERHGNLGEELPVIGGSAGEMAKLSASLSEPALAVGDLLGLVGDLSAQQLLDLCDPDTIGDRVAALDLSITELQSLLPAGATGDAASLLDQLETAAEGAAAECADLLDGIGYDATAHAITYEVGFTADHDLAEVLGSSLDLGFAEDAGLEGLSVAVRGGDWTTSTASVDFALTLGVKLGTHEQLAIHDGVTTTDFDGDGELDTVDTDTDADGLPERFTFADGDRCRALASLFAQSTSALQAHLGITGPTQNADGSVALTEDALCDAELVTGTDMAGWKIGGDGDAVTTLTDSHVCAAAAARFGLEAADFVTLNAPTVTTANCGGLVRHGGTDGEYTYDADEAMTPTAALPHRIYVSVDDPLVAAELAIEGTGVGATADLGILDLDIDFTDLRFEPSLTVGLVDPGTLEKADEKVDLWELAHMADTDRLDDLLDVDFDGEFVVKADLSNAIVMPDGPRGFDVYGDVADLGSDLADADDAFTFHEGRLDSAPAADGTIHVGHDLDELLNLGDLTPAQALQMIVGVLEEVAAMGDTAAMATPIPFIDTSPQEMVDFSRSFADIVTKIEERDPADISALQAALNDALTAAGMPDGLTVGVTDTELTLSFDGSREVTRSYPFVFDTSDFPDLGPLSFAPADGGATVSARAGVTFEPTIGISFAEDIALEDRIFLRGAAPTFDVEIDADVFGSVHFGPAVAAIRGEAELGDPEAAELAISFKDSAGSVTDEVTLGDLVDIVKSPTTRIGVEFEGPFSADLDVSATIGGLGTVRGGLLVSGNLNDLRATTAEVSGFDGIDFDLDLGTFVDGSIASARFVARTLEQSEALSGDLPFLGDELATLATVGADLRTAADEIDALWRKYGEDPEQTTNFLDEIVLKLEGALCGAFPEDGCVITMELLDGEGEPGASIATANAFEIGLKLAQSDETQIDLEGGLDLEVFTMDMEMDPTLRYGYGLDVVLGVNLTDGFYLRPGNSMDTDDDGDGDDFLQLFAGMDSAVEASVDLAGLAASVTAGNVEIGGALGPGGNNGGIAVGLVGDNDKLTMRDLTNRRTKIETIVAPRYDLDIKADLPVEVQVPGVADLSVPVHFSLEGSGLEAPTPRLLLGCGAELSAEEIATFCPDDFEHIGLDASSFVDAIIKPILKDILGNPSYNPLAQPAIKSALDSDIPILDTQLRKVIREVAIASGQEAAWSLIEFLVDVGSIDFDCGATGPATGLGTEGCFDGQINLGWAEVVPEFVHHEPDDWGIPQPLTDLITNLRRLSGATGLGAKPPTTPTTTTATTPPTGGTTTPTTPPKKPGLAAGSMLSFPILEDPGSALNLVLGEELSEPVTFIEFAPPPVTIGKQINFSRTLFSLDIGFLKGGLTLALKGELGLTLHAGFGYDSTGISTGNLLDGFYLVDHEGYEVGLGGSIAGLIDGHFSVAGDIVSVRFRGSAGANLKAGLDLFDDSIALPAHSRNNGKLHLWEMGLIDDAYPSPFCMFALGARFDANLAFSGKAKVLGITVFNESWSGNWVLVDERLTCNPNEVPAHVDDERRLVLNGGAFADFRFSTGTKAGDLEEHFTVSQAGDKIRVEMTSDQHTPAITKDFDPAEFDSIHADLGNGPNSVSIADGIVLPATLVGGPHADTLKGGGGEDSVDGAGGNDIVSGGPAADVILGGDGNDSLDGNAGHDDLQGGDGTNTYVFGNAHGADQVEDTGADATLDFSAVTTSLVGRGFYAEGEMKTTDGSVAYFSDEVMDLIGGSGADDVEINGSYPDGFTSDLGGGGDKVTLLFSGIDRTINVEDSGDGIGDEMVVMGTAADNIFLFRGDGPGTGKATEGYVAMGARDFIAGEQELAEDLAAAKLADPDLDEAVWTENYEQNQARIKLVPGLIDRVDYDDEMESITTKGVAGANHFYLDDAAAPLTIDGGDGGNTFQVGQIYRNARNEVRTRESYVSEAEEPDHLSYGVSHPTTINGGQGNDQFTVYSNTAKLNLNGVSGDNVFILRAFVLDGTVEAVGGDGNDRFEYVKNDQVDIDGGDGFNTMIIVGTPFSDGYILSDTGVDVCPLPSGAAATTDPKQRLPIDGADCAIDVTYERIQSVVVHGLHGNDVFWVRASDAATHHQLYGGTDGATFYVQDPVLGVTGVAGPVTIEGDFDPTFDVSLRKPVVLPGEDDIPARGTQRVTYTHQDDRLIVDAGVHTTDDVGSLIECVGYTACREDSSRIVGLGMGDDAAGFRDSVEIRIGTDRTDPDVPVEILRDYPTGLTYHTVDELTVELGSGADVFTVESTHTSTDLDEVETVTETVLRTGAGDDEVTIEDDDGPTRVETATGDDHVQIDDITAPTELDLGGDDDDVRVGEGTGDGDVTGIAELLDVTAGAGDDDVEIDARAGSADEDGQRVDLDLVRDDAVPAFGVLTELEMDGSVRHDATLESLRILTGAGADVANVRGSLAGVTELHTADGDDRTFVSTAADLGLADATPGLLGGRLDDVVGAVHDDAGAGDNLLMISDRNGTVGRTVSADEGSVAVEGLGAITYEAAGTFAGGVTTWLGHHDDTVTEVSGARSDESAPTFLAWEDPRVGAVEARTLTTFNTGSGHDDVTVALPADHGLLVVNLENGDDTLHGGSSAVGFAAFGGAGADRIETGAGDDVAFGDFGRIEYRDGDDDLTGVIGVPSRMDLVTGEATAPTTVETCNEQPTVSDGDVSGCAGIDSLVESYRIQHDVTAPGAPTVPVRNWISVGGGDDVAFGGRDADWIDATGGRNAIVGDHGAVARVPNSELGGRRTITSSDGSIDHTVLEEDFAYEVDVQDVRLGSADVLLGGANRDWVFAGQGDDLVNGRAGNDIIFGGFGPDLLWGGAGDDRIYGGWGDDLVDLKAMDATVGKKGVTSSRDEWPIDEPVVTSGVRTSWWSGAPVVPRTGWSALAPSEDTDKSAATANGSDLIFGGEGPDAMQADVGGAGPIPGDRMIDWRGAHNVYLVCDGAYGAGRVVRLSSPTIVDKLGEIRVADGAAGANGADQMAIPTSGNSNPTHPAHPGNNLGC